MGPYLGDFKEDSIVYFCWDTNNKRGASITRATNGTIKIYKDDGLTESTAGITDTEDFDGITGIHNCKIDLSANVFYAIGHDYSVALVGAVIDGETVNAVLATFSIENRFDEVDVTKLGGAAQSATDLKDLADAGYDPATHKIEACKANDDMRGTDSASTHSAADVWSVATRTLTSFGTLVQDIWDKATSALTTVGSIGKLIVDNLNATITSRSSHSAADAGTDAASKVLATPANKLATDVNGKVTVENTEACKATGFSTHNAAAAGTDAAGKVLTTPANKLATDATGKVTVGNPDDCKATGFSTHSAADVVNALLAKTGITAGATWTYQKLMKVIAAWIVGKWQDKTGQAGTYEVLDPDDGTTVIAEVTPSETSPQKQVTVL